MVNTYAQYEIQDCRCNCSALPSQYPTASLAATRLSAPQRLTSDLVSFPHILPSPTHSYPPFFSSFFLHSFTCTVKSKQSRMFSNMLKLALIGAAAIMVNGQSTSTAPIGDGMQILSPGGPDVWWGMFLAVIDFLVYEER